jgi:phytoene synthase
LTNVNVNITESDHTEITKGSKTNFLYSFSLLPKEKNDAINTVYAFCRKTDDIVDDETTSIVDRFTKINDWRKELEKALKGNSNNALFNQLNVIINKFNIPIEPFFELIRGMEMDLEKNRYETFEELNKYCYRAAATVGLMCIEIFGYRNSSAKDFAVNLGIALQLTNILRDIKKDALNNRIYIPRGDLEKFGYSEKELLENKYNDSFIELMKYESERARKFYKKADSYLSKEDKGLMFPARIMQHIYFNVLKNIEKSNYNVFEKYAKVSKFRKIFITLGVYLKYRLLYSFNDTRMKNE